MPKGWNLDSKPTGYPYIRVTDFNGRGSLDMDDMLYLDRKAYEQMSKYTISPDDLYISITGTIGKAGMIPPRLNNAILTENACKLVFQPDIDPRFVYYFTQSRAFQREAKQRTRVTAVPKLALFRLATIPVPFPSSLSEQQRIVDYLDKAFARIEIVYGNTQKNLQNTCELFCNLLNSLFITTDAGWEQVRLGDRKLLEIIAGDRGRNYPKRYDYQPEGYCLFLNAGNISTFGFNFEKTNFINRKKDCALGNGKLARNDIIMTIRGTIGNVALYDDTIRFEHVRVNSGVLILRPNPAGIIPEFLACLLLCNRVKTQIRLHASGATQPQLSKRSLENFVVPVPRSLAEQQRIVACIQDYARETEMLKDTYSQKLVELEELKQSILQRAFSGEL